MLSLESEGKLKGIWGDSFASIVVVSIYDPNTIMVTRRDLQEQLENELQDVDFELFFVPRRNSEEKVIPDGWKRAADMVCQHLRLMMKPIPTSPVTEREWLNTAKRIWEQTG